MSSNEQKGSTSSDVMSTLSTTAEDVKSDVDDVVTQAKSTVKDIADSEYNENRNELTDQLEGVSDAIDDAARTLSEQNTTLGHYTSELADNLSGLTERIRNSSLEDVASETRTLARENPAMFMLGSVAIGLVASRFFKASSQFNQGADYYHDRFGRSQRFGHSQSETNPTENNQTRTSREYAGQGSNDSYSPTSSFSNSAGTSTQSTKSENAPATGKTSGATASSTEVDI